MKLLQFFLGTFSEKLLAPETVYNLPLPRFNTPESEFHSRGTCAEKARWFSSPTFTRISEMKLYNLQTGLMSY